VFYSIQSFSDVLCPVKQLTKYFHYDITMSGSLEAMYIVHTLFTARIFFFQGVNVFVETVVLKHVQFMGTRNN
jgi:hypothetical protein